MNYVVKARARLDLKKHWQYIAKEDLIAADRLLEAAEKTFKLIAENPEIGSQRCLRKPVGIRSRAGKEQTDPSPQPSPLPKGRGRSIFGGWYPGLRSLRCACPGLSSFAPVGLLVLAR